MPQAMPIIAVISAVASVVSLAIALSMKTPSAKDASDTGSQIQSRGKDDPKLVSFGRCRVPAARVFSNVYSTNTRYMTQVWSLGVGPVQAVEKIYVDENLHIAPQADHWYGYGSSQEFPNLGCGVRLGKTTEAAYQRVIDLSDGLWTSHHRGDRTASISVDVERRIDKKAQDQPYRLLSSSFKIEADVRGNAVIDPRHPDFVGMIDDVNKRVWTYGGSDSYRNPACVIFTYILDRYYGMGVPLENLDVTSFIALANYCDSMAYRFDGYIDQSKNWGQILTDFASSFDGWIFVQDGKITVRPDTVGYSSVSFDTSNIIGNINVSADGMEYFNCLKVNFNNENNLFETDNAVLPVNVITDQTIINDGRKIEKTLDLKFTTSPTIVKRTINTRLKKAKLCRKTVDFTINALEYKGLKIGDVFDLTDQFYGFNKALFRVTQIESTLDDDVLKMKIKGEEHNNAVYDSSAFDDPIYGSTLPVGSMVVDAPTALAFTQGNTTGIGQGVLEWQCTYGKEARFIVQLKRSTDTEWLEYTETPTESTLISGLVAGATYDFRVRTVGSIGGSYWAVLSGITINRNLALPAVTGLSADFSGADLLLSWTPISGAVTGDTLTTDGITDLSQCVGYYEIVISHGTTAKQTFRVTDPRLTYTHADNLKNGLSRDVRATVRAVSRWGDAGALASINAFNDPMAAPSGVQVRSQLVQFNVLWNNPSDQISDYESTDVYLLPTAITAVHSNYLVGTSSNGSFSMILPDDKKQGYLALAHRDYFGHTTPITATQPIYYSETSIDDLISGSDWVEEVDDRIKNLIQLTVDNNGSVDGMQIGATDTRSFVAFKADTFQVMNNTTAQPVFEIRDGNTMIKNGFIGNLTASQITAGAVNGSHINASSAITIGSGNTSTTISGVDPNYRLWAGHSSPDSAPFRVAKDGSMYASNASIKGTVMADAGYFRGSLEIGSAAAGTMTIRNNQINVYDENGTLRVRIGLL